MRRSPAVAAAALAAAAAAQAPPAVVLNVSDVQARTLAEYASCTLEWWDDEHQHDGSWAGANLFDIDLASPRLRAAARALSPGLLRLGGSLDTIVKYLVGGMTPEECAAPSPLKGFEWHLCMNMTRWDAVLDFARDVGLDLVLGLPYPGACSGDCEWASANAVALLEHTAAHGARVRAVELGEEMHPKPGTAAFAHLVAAYGELKAQLARVWPDADARPLLLGPCVGMGDEQPGGAFMEGFLGATLPNGTLDAVCMHSYNNDGGDGWRDEPGFLKQTLAQAETMLDAAARHSGGRAKVWCGECAGHNHGGVENRTDCFFSSFWYLDALGRLASLGVAELGRQTLVGSNYGMLDMGTFEPRPDLYVAVLWTRLMGPASLRVDAPAAPPGLHVYAHCAPGAANGSVTVAWANLSPSDAAVVDAGLPGPRADYVLTAPDGILSRSVALNGAPLRLSGDALPPLAAEWGGGGALAAPPRSVGFAAFPDARHPHCAD